jgi:hypothetical protein
MVSSIWTGKRTNEAETRVSKGTTIGSCSHRHRHHHRSLLHLLHHLDRRNLLHHLGHHHHRSLGHLVLDLHHHLRNGPSPRAREGCSRPYSP